MRPRRVLLAFEPTDGGVAEWVRQMALGAGQHGWQVELAGPSDATPYDAALAAGVRVHRLSFDRGYGRPQRDARTLVELTRILAAGNFDVVHCHAAKAGVLGRLVAAARGTPAVYSPHCYPFVGEVGVARRIATTAIERALARAAAATICVCEHERQVARARGIGPASRLRVVANGTAAGNGTAPDRTLSDLRHHGPTVTAIAALRPQKRLDVFLDSIPAILAQVPQARVAIVGNGPLGPQLRERACALGLDTDERFAFVKFEAGSAAYLAATDVYVLTSSWEAMPIGLLEALAAGVPQVATRVGGTPEAVTSDTGLLVAPRDPDAVACAVVELLRDPERRAAMSRASRKRHGELFAIDRMVRETVAVYEEVAARNQRAPLRR